MPPKGESLRGEGDDHETPRRTLFYSGLAKLISAGISEGLTEVLKAVKTIPVVEDPLQAAIRIKARIDSLTNLPSPLLLGNNQVLKEPYLWILFISKSNLVRGHFRGEFGTRGPVLIAFEDALTVAYPLISAHVKVEISSLFSQVGMIVINHPAENGIEDLLDTLKPCCDRATSLINDLDCTVISTAIGENGGQVFSKNRSLDLKNFSAAAQGAVTSALRSRGGGEGGRGGYHGGRGNGRGTKRDREEGTGERKCYKCFVTVPAGTSFRDHRKVCKKVT